MNRLFFRISLRAILVALVSLACNEANDPAATRPSGLDMEAINERFLSTFFIGDSALVALGKESAARHAEQLVFVNIEDQLLSVLSLADTFRVVFSAQISSGRGKSTPRGIFSVLKKRLSRPSRKYGGTMTYWNCLTADEAIGIHGLKDHSYLKYLGQPVSHGCIRIGKKDEKEFYYLVPLGTTVVVK